MALCCKGQRVDAIQSSAIINSGTDDISGDPGKGNVPSRRRAAVRGGQEAVSVDSVRKHDAIETHEDGEHEHGLKEEKANAVSVVRA